MSKWHASCLAAIRSLAFLHVYHPKRIPYHVYLINQSINQSTFLERIAKEGRKEGRKESKQGRKERRELYNPLINYVYPPPLHPRPPCGVGLREPFLFRYNMMV